MLARAVATRMRQYKFQPFIIGNGSAIHTAVAQTFVEPTADDEVKAAINRSIFLHCGVRSSEIGVQPIERFAGCSGLYTDK